MHAHSRLEPGQDHSAGRAVKKTLKPFRERILIDDLRNRHGAKRYAHHAVSRHPDGEALKIKAAKVLAA
jgi:hypothetical protein